MEYKLLAVKNPIKEWAYVDRVAVTPRDFGVWEHPVVAEALQSYVAEGWRVAHFGIESSTSLLFLLERPS